MSLLPNPEPTPDKLLNPLENLLSRFKVIHQITLIILLMIVFLVIQGVLTLHTFNKMQTVSQKVFNSSIQGFQATTIIGRELAGIRNQYTMNLFDQQRQYLSFVDLDSALASLSTSINIVDFDLDSKKDLDFNIRQLNKQVEKLKKLAKQPINRGNYHKISRVLKALTLSVKTIENTLTNNALITMRQGNKFFESSRNVNILIVTVSAVLSLGIGLAIATMISKPLKEMVRVVGLMATGDFTNMIKIKGSLEVKKLVDGLNHAILSLRNLVCKINEQAQTLANASKEINNASHEAGRSASEVARAIENMAQASFEQSKQMTNTANTVTELGQLVRKVSADSMAIADSSQHVSDSAKIGQKITTDVALDMGEIYSTTKKISMVINEVNRTSEEIRGIIALIEGIAEQTSLLALNASIEAARAGEHGKGFSVVASETKKLAEQSKLASKKIRELIIQMIDRSNNAVQVIQKGVIKVEVSKELTGKATVTFENIFHELENMLSQIHNVALSAQQMAKHNENVVESVTSVAEISQEGMSTTEEIAATVVQQSASAQEVAAFAENLADIAAAMQRSIGAFKI
jgi:methyl-accepting chemotaxis protein